MERRKFIIGVGALGAGTSAALSTGAFTNVEADRSFSVSTAGDADAYLRMTSVPDSPNAEYVDTGGDTLSVSLDSLNEDAVTTVEDLFLIQNEGTQAISVYLTDSSDAVTFSTDGDSIEGPNDAVRLGVGESATVDIEVDTTDAAGQLLDTVTIMAKSQVFEPGSTDVVTVGPGGSGTDASTLSAGLTQAAEQNAQAVLLKTGRYAEFNTVETGDLTIKAESGASPVIESPEETAGSGTLLKVNAPNVTVEGLTFESPSHVLSEKNPYPSRAGIGIGSEASGISIVDNTFQQIGTATDAEGNSAGISGGAGVSDISIVGNTFTDISTGYFDGEYFDWYSAKAIYLSSNPSGSEGDSSSIRNVSIRGNDISGISSPVQSFGIELHHDVSGVEIVDNHISGVFGDVDNEYTGAVDGDDPFDTAAAIYLARGEPTGPSDVTISGNYLSAESATGDGFTPGASVLVEGSADADSITVTENDLEAPVGITNRSGRGAVMATNNWWKAADGPAGVLADGTETSVASAGSATADGSGSYVVDFDDDGTAAVNFDDYRSEPVFSRRYAVSQDGSAQFESIDAAVDAARPGDDVVIVDDATYSFAQNLVLDKPVSLTTATDSSPTIDFSEGGGIALKAAADVQDLTITGGYSGAGLQSESGKVGISVQSSGSVIANNDISGFYGGIQTLSDTSDVTIHGNTVEDTAFAIATQGGNDSITENTVSSDIQSIATWKADGVTIEDNTVTVDSTGLTGDEHWGGDAPGRGIEIGGADVTVSGNDVTAVADRDVVFYLSRSEATNTESGLMENNSYDGSPVFVDGGN